MTQIATNAAFNMNALPQNNILIIDNEIREVVRKEFNLHKAEAMKEAVDILQTWIEKQDHLLKKDYTTLYLENTIIGCKGSIERAKAMIDKSCTQRTLSPEYFCVQNVAEMFGDIQKICDVVVMPKVTKQYSRLFIVKVNSLQYTDCVKIVFQYCFLIAEYIKNHDVVPSYQLIYDMTGINLSEVVSHINFLEYNNLLRILLEGYGARLKRIHIITKSSLVDSMVSLVKKAMKPKLAARIVCNQTPQELHEHYSLDTLPKDFGGTEKSIGELHDVWFKELCSEENIRYLKDMDKARTDESLRSSATFSENYAGMAGTFRFLHVD